MMIIFFLPYLVKAPENRAPSIAPKFVTDVTVTLHVLISSSDQSFIAPKQVKTLPQEAMQNPRRKSKKTQKLTKAEETHSYGQSVHNQVA